MKTALFIGLFWPEPTTSAAGARTMRLMEWLQQAGYRVHSGATASPSAYSAVHGKAHITTHHIVVNDTSFDEFITELNPDVVIYDTFLSEEQFGWRVKKHAPQSLQVLDLQDLHFLRQARSKAKLWDNGAQEELSNATTFREVAGVYRCDLTLVISKTEYTLLVEQFNVPKSLLIYLPLVYDFPAPNGARWANRSGFCSIGSFKHKPNVDLLSFTLSNLWPRIKRKLPDATWHIYGTYAGAQSHQFHHPQKGVYLVGHADFVVEVMHSHRVLLAPVRFGAGLKGKLLDACYYGIPSVTTPIGAEGIQENEQWAGVCSSDIDALIEETCTLYSDQTDWEKAVNNGNKLISKFNASTHRTLFLEALNHLVINLENHRRSNFIGQMIGHHRLKSTEYLSRFIETKKALEALRLDSSNPG